MLSSFATWVKGRLWAGLDKGSLAWPEAWPSGSWRFFAPMMAVSLLLGKVSLATVRRGGDLSHHKILKPANALKSLPHMNSGDPKLIYLNSRKTPLQTTSTNFPSKSQPDSIRCHLLASLLFQDLNPRSPWNVPPPSHASQTWQPRHHLCSSPLCDAVETWRHCGSQCPRRKIAADSGSFLTFSLSPVLQEAHNPACQTALSHDPGATDCR